MSGSRCVPRRLNAAALVGRCDSRGVGAYLADRRDADAVDVTEQLDTSYDLCLVKLGFRKRARLSFRFRHERFSGFGAGTPLSS